MLFALSISTVSISSATPRAAVVPPALSGTPSVQHPEDAVTTRSYNNQRTGATLNETILNTGNVNTAQFGKIFTRPIDGQMYATPLYVPELDIPNKGVHNVIYVATQKNKVYAFDADDPAANTPLWSVNLGPYGVSAEQEFGTRYNGVYRDILPYVGITSTPVIDLESGTIYVVAFRKLATMSYEHRLYALDMRTGAEKSNVKVEGSVTGTSPHAVNGVITFNSRKQLQRVSLLLQGSVVYLAFAGYADTDPYHGWIFGYDAATLDRRYIFNTTPDIDPPNESQPDANDGEGGIWMSGQGISTDEQGDLYMAIGNGNFNAYMAGGRNYGNGIVRIRPLTSTLEVQTWFTPHNYVYLNEVDLDLGVSGVLLMPGTNLAVAGSKEGKLYVVNRTAMGGLGNGNDNQIVQTFLGTAAINNHIHGSLVYWNSPGGPRIYQWGEKDKARTFLFNTTTGLFNPTPTSMSAFQLPNGMPGGILSLSANNNVAGSGILWATHPEGDANNATKPGVLRAFNAEDLGVELWNSKTNAARDSVGNFAKFNPPMVANGRVYVGNFSTSTSANTDQLVVYGLLAPSIVTPPEDQTVPGNTSATLRVVATGAGPLSYQWYRVNNDNTTTLITGAISSTLTTGPIAQVSRFQVRVTNSTSVVVTSPTVTVTPYFAPSITTQPASKTVPGGTTTTLSVVAAGSGPFVYQWFSGPSGNTASPITGATTSTLTTPPITQVRQFWVRVSDGINTVNSATATVTPYFAPSITTQPASETVPARTDTTLSVTAAGSGPFTYQWYQGASGNTSSPIAGATSATLATGPIIQTTQFWVRVSDATQSVDSATATVTPQYVSYVPMLRR